MPAINSAAYVLLAESLTYPAPGRLALLERGFAAAPDWPGKRAYAAFLGQVRGLSLGEWEELHTRTLDLNPPAAPYVGYQTWGESYGRGTFLATMNRALMETGIDAGGELPDHLAPVLRYLAACDEPLAELVDVLGPAIERMLAALRRAEPDNPYADLLDAIREQCATLKKEDA